MRSLGYLCLFSAAVLSLVRFFAPDLQLLADIDAYQSALPGRPPIAVALGVVGTILVLPSILRPRWRPTESIQPVSRPLVQPKAPTPTPDPSERSNGDWRDQLIQAVGQMETGQGVSLHIDRSLGTPITLVLERCTPGRIRRALSQLGKLLTQVPRPPRVAIIFQDCERANVPWSHVVNGALAPHIGRNTARVVNQADRVDLFFADSDPCYAGQPAPENENENENESSSED